MTTQSELKELNDLRKEKQATLCDKIKESITCIGEDLGKTERHIQELMDLQDARIKYFNSIMEGA